MILTYNNIKAAIKRKGYKFFEGEHNINRVGIRTANRTVNNYDDYFCLLWQEKGENKIYIDDEFTTDPGIYYMQKELLSPKGCAILVPNQYLGMHQIGLHRGKYEAFVQRKPCKVFRDRNKDNYLDFDIKTIEEGIFGINQHHGYESDFVDRNSAACQVHKRSEALVHVLNIAKKSATIYGNSFTYTLLEIGDV
jgi:hypothetical protein